MAPVGACHAAAILNRSPLLLQRSSFAKFCSCGANAAPWLPTQAWFIALFISAG